MKVPRVLVLLALVASCRGLGTPAGVAQAERQLKAAAESTSDVLDLARRDAPELVRALEEASRELAREGRIDTLEEVLALVESTILLSADQPRIGLALVTLKAALLQLKAASP